MKTTVRFGCAGFFTNQEIGIGEMVKVFRSFVRFRGFFCNSEGLARKAKGKRSSHCWSSSCDVVEVELHSYDTRGALVLIRELQVPESEDLEEHPDDAVEIRVGIVVRHRDPGRRLQLRNQLRSWGPPGSHLATAAAGQRTIGLCSNTETPGMIAQLRRKRHPTGKWVRYFAMQEKVNSKLPEKLFR